MEIKWLNDTDIRPTKEPLMALIAFDESHALVSLLDDGFEHNILLRKMKGTDENLDKYYRIIVDEDGADWTLFYKNGFSAISRFLKELDYKAEIEIPKRYRRHI